MQPGRGSRHFSLAGPVRTQTCPRSKVELPSQSSAIRTPTLTSSSFLALRPFLLISPSPKMNPFNRKKNLDERMKKWAEKEAEIKRLEGLQQREQAAAEARNKLLLEEKARKLAKEKLAIAEAQIEVDTRNARKAAEKLQKDAHYQEKKRIEAEQKLIDLQQQNEEALRLSEFHAKNANFEAQRRYDEERRAREEAEQRLLDMLAMEDMKRWQEEEDLRIAQDEERKHVLRLQKAQRELEERIRQEEKKRQRDEVQNGNSPEALRELRELARRRYELDMDIWQNRLPVLPANRQLWERKMIRADAILHEIQNRVQKWEFVDETTSGWTQEEWEMAKEVKERLLAPGKRNWAAEPPWETGPRKPPVVTRRRGRKSSAMA